MDREANGGEEAWRCGSEGRVGVNWGLKTYFTGSSGVKVFHSSCGFAHWFFRKPQITHTTLISGSPANKTSTRNTLRNPLATDHPAGPTRQSPSRAQYCTLHLSADPHQRCFILALFEPCPLLYSNPGGRGGLDLYFSF